MHIVLLSRDDISQVETPKAEIHVVPDFVMPSSSRRRIPFRMHEGSCRKAALISLAQRGP